jgi:NADH-quinone oxidoreductase subunit K
MFINLTFILTITLLVFIIGLLGLVLNRKNFIIIIVSIEIILLSVNLNFLFFSLYLDDIVGQIFVLFILTVAATESSLGLAILISYYRLKNDIFIDNVKKLKS